MFNWENKNLVKESTGREDFSRPGNDPIPIVEKTLVKLKGHLSGGTSLGRAIKVVDEKKKSKLWMMSQNIGCYL